MSFKWKHLLEQGGGEIDSKEYERLEGIANALDYLSFLRESYSTPSDAEGKTWYANDAVSRAFYLMCREAEWAIHHLVGLAEGGDCGEPLLDPRADDPRDAQGLQEAGAHIARQPSKLDPIVRRLALTNVLTAFRPAGTSLGPLLFELTHSLRALDTGEQLPLVTPESSPQKAKYRIQLHHLSATCFEEFMSASGKTLEDARAFLTECYGYRTRHWRQRLLEQPYGLTKVEVVNSITLARLSGEIVKKSKEYPEDEFLSEMAKQALKDYGPSAVREDGAAYKSLMGFDVQRDCTERS